jgi:hypothetical protein
MVKGDTVRVSARVVWEDCERPEVEIYYEAGGLFAAAVSTAADAFLIASVLPAFRHGERRILVEDHVSPELIQGLTAVMTWLGRWFRPSAPIVNLEVRSSPSAVPSGPKRAGFFLSGGVDSLATLSLNRLHYPPTHPGFLRDGVLVFGLEVEHPEAFEHARRAAEAIAADAGVELVPVSTNVRALDADWVFYRDEFQGAILASIAHALACRLDVVSIAATFDAANLGPWGSHPLIDPNFSTHGLRVVHDGVALSRLDKVRLLVDWPAALRHMRVCNKADRYQAGVLNCGACEKCVRTMLELLALGALDRAGAFVERDVSAESASRVSIHDAYVASCYRELIAPLTAVGRPDLAGAVQTALARYEGRPRHKTFLKRIDRTYLGGRLARMKRVLRRPTRSAQPPAGQEPTKADR